MTSIKSIEKSVLAPFKSCISRNQWVRHLSFIEVELQESDYFELGGKIEAPRSPRSTAVRQNLRGLR